MWAIFLSPFVAAAFTFSQECEGFDHGGFQVYGIASVQFLVWWE
jgi:hypothetical protein